jgi:hypothetical protein
MTLVELQRRMLTVVKQPLTTNYGMRSRMNGKSVATEVEVFIKPNDRLNSFERLEIYNRQYWFRLLSGMSEDFPGLDALLGDRAFQKLSVEYLTAHPSSSFTMRNLGSHLESFLTAYEKPLEIERDLLLDVARLEWAHIEAFDNGEAPPLTARQSAGLQESSHVALQPHLRLLSLRYPVDNYVVAIHREMDEPEVASNAFTGRKRGHRKKHLQQLVREEIFLGVHRLDESIYYKRLDRDAFAILQSLDAGKTLGEALETALAGSDANEEAFAANLSGWFQNWGQLGWLTKRVQL